jgi:hypothetical protein
MVIHMLCLASKHDLISQRLVLVEVEELDEELLLAPPAFWLCSALLSTFSLLN